MRQSSPAGLKALIIFLVILMVGNVLMLARSLELLRFPGEITDTEVVRGGARVLAPPRTTSVSVISPGNPFLKLTSPGIQRSETPLRSSSSR